MAITVPVVGQEISAGTFGIPVATEVNRLTTLTAPTAWTNPVYTNGWAGLTSSGIQPAQYRKIGDIVYIRGNIYGGSLGVSAFTLPVGFRPPLNLYPMVIAQGGTLGYLVVGSAGTIVPNAANNGQIGMECQFSVTV